MGHPDFTELHELEALIADGGHWLETQVACEVAVGERRFPVYALALGNPDPALPVVGFFGGFHGLERIGTAVVLAYLRTLVRRLPWDSILQRQLEAVRLVFMPIVNPGGMWRGTRANPNGVDLMRNAPVEAQEKPPFLLGGQRLSARLPWYRGPQGAAMEAENLAVCRLVEREFLSRDFGIAIDCHSGFGISDRIWFPYAHTATPIAHLPEVLALKEIYDQAHPNHRYVFEPQSRQYLAHGDLWDYLYQRASAAPERIFLPLTLEMGSWLWVKKNPRQLFSRHGMFNPQIEHRQQRVLRRHVAWLDFLARAACGYRLWLPDAATRERYRERALRHWYWRAKA
ncbi:MAG: zinc carboxypeptidase [Betaproteobacteria bacterium HGW-Betaproteobacteria-12]|nr:MAG: zinc carboxypeptidase [Betaproteobacteria bacterium HGW-Betaproteobacteria-12]